MHVTREDSQRRFLAQHSVAMLFPPHPQSAPESLLAGARMLQRYMISYVVLKIVAANRLV